jgi:hypothetical protein
VRFLMCEKSGTKQSRIESFEAWIQYYLNLHLP